MTTTTKHIDLQAFCYPETNQRYALSKPRLLDGMACATDGRMLIRCKPEFAEPFEPAEGKFPNVSDVMTEIDSCTFAPVEIPVCKSCDNKPIKMIECSECYGEGRAVCSHCEHEDECWECEGTGKEQWICPKCRDSIVISGRTLAGRLVYPVASLPGVVWEQDERGSTKGLYFKFDHGDGAVMPLQMES